MYKAKHASRAIAGLVILSLLLAVSVSHSSAQPLAAPGSAPVSQAASGSNQAQPGYNNVQWSAAQDISHASIALGPWVAMNGGEAQINFTLGSSSLKEIYETYSGDNGHTWAAPRYRGCDNGSTSGTTVQQIAEDTHLNVYMVWEDYCGNTRQLYFKKYDAASNQWLPTRALTSFNVNGGAVAVGPDGVVHISYVHVYQSGSNGVVEYIYSTNGGNSFSPPTALSNGGTWVTSTVIAVDTLNRPHVAYDRAGNIVARDFVNGAWIQTILYTGRVFWPKMAANHSGGVGVVWQINDAGVQALYSRWNATSQQWDPTPTQVSVNDGSNFYPALTYDNLDDAYVTWTESAGSGDLHLAFSYEYSPGTWSPEVRVQDTRATLSNMANYNNNLVLAYQYDGNGDWEIWSSWMQLPQGAQPTNTPTITNTPASTNTPVATPTPCPGQMFVDVNCSYWAYYFIQSLAQRGIVTGQGGYFSPARLITRAELTAIIRRAQNWPLVNPPNPTFSDVPPSYFAYQDIESAVAHGAISGYSDNGTYRPCADAGTGSPCFLPNNLVKRDETAVIIVRASAFPPVNPPNPTFPDVPPTYWAYSAIETAHARGILSGQPDGRFHPTDHTRRDEMAKIVYRAMPAITSISPTSAQAGSNTLVTIVGRNFGDPQTISSTLQVNGVTMNIVSWHDTVVNFTIPANTPPTPSPALIQLTWNNKLAFIENNTTFTVLPAATATPGGPTNTPGASNTPLPTMTVTTTPGPSRQ